MNYHAEHPAQIYQELRSLSVAADCHLTISQSVHCFHTGNIKDKVRAANE